MNKNGFTLIEVLLYVMLTAIVTVALFYLSTNVVIEDRAQSREMIALLELEKLTQEISRNIVVGDPTLPVVLTPGYMSFTNHFDLTVEIIYSAVDEAIIMRFDGLPIQVHSTVLNVTDFSIMPLNVSSGSNLYEISITGNSGFNRDVSFRTAIGFGIGSLVN